MTKLLSKVRILDCDYKTTNRRIYPLAEVERAIKVFMIDSARPGAFINDIEDGNSTITADKISHIVKTITIQENKEVLADIEVLDTPAGLKLQQLIDKSDYSVRFFPKGTGLIDTTSYIISGWNIDAIVYDLE